MFPRNFFTIFGLVLFITIASIHAAEIPKTLPENEIEEKLNPVLKEILEFLQKWIIGVAKKCIKQAAEHCKDYWGNPQELLTCAKDYLASGDCILHELESWK